MEIENVDRIEFPLNRPKKRSRNESNWRRNVRKNSKTKGTPSSVKTKKKIIFGLNYGTSDLITGLVHLNCAGDVIQARNLQIVDCACDCRNRFRIEELTRIF